MKKKMKKVISLILVGTMMLSLCACGKGDSKGNGARDEDSANTMPISSNDNAKEKQEIELTADNFKDYIAINYDADNDVSKENLLGRFPIYTGTSILTYTFAKKKNVSFEDASIALTTTIMPSNWDYEWTFDSKGVEVPYEGSDGTMHTIYKRTETILIPYDGNINSVEFNLNLTSHTVALGGLSPRYGVTTDIVVNSGKVILND